MISALTNPEMRRGIRTIVQAVIMFALLAMVWSMIDDLHGNVDGLREIARYALIIIGLSEVGYAMENGFRAIKFTINANGASADATGDNGNG